ncbi:MAG: histidinol-phosphatase, partial [Ignavibacteriae bacterium]|nr:histidinol-phosphatase [Ignavibacteriota bacterium]
MAIDKTGSAVFFDRDGVITKPVYSEKFGEYQPPHFPGEVVFYGEVIAVLRDFMTLGIPLIVVSNQPDAAKGKISLENL